MICTTSGSAITTYNYDESTRAIQNGLKLLQKTDHDCLDSQSDGGLVDPIALLNKLAGMNDFVTGSLTADPGTVLSAITSVSQMSPVSLSNNATQLQASGITVTINDTAGNFVNGTARS